MTRGDTLNELKSLIGWDPKIRRWKTTRELVILGLKKPAETERTMKSLQDCYVALY
jgi:hypothetical protein